MVADVPACLQFIRTVSCQLLLRLLQELLRLLSILQLFDLLRLLSYLLVLVGLFLARVQYGLGFIDQHLESKVFLFILEGKDDLVAPEVVFLKGYPLLRVCCDFLRSDFLVQTLPFSMLNPVVAICLGLIEQLLFELKRVQSHQSQRIPDQRILDTMI